MIDTLIVIGGFCLIFLISLLIVMFCHESQIARLESNYSRLRKGYKKLLRSHNSLIDVDIEFVNFVFNRFDELEKKRGKKR